MLVEIGSMCLIHELIFQDMEKNLKDKYFYMKTLVIAFGVV